MQFKACLVTVALVTLCHAAANSPENSIPDEKCPLSCECTGNIIKCSNMNIFPDVPMETVEFQMTRSQVSSIPMNVFLNAPNLERISLSHMSIETLRACSFAELENITEIVFQSVRISIMERNTFSNLVNITKLTFEGCSISEMRSFSIHGASKIGSLSFLRTNITTLHPFTLMKIDNVDKIIFENCNIKNFLYSGIFDIKNCTDFVIKHSRIDFWQCGSLDAFAGSATGVTVSHTHFRCDCNLTWLWEEYPDQPVISEDSNICLTRKSRLSEQTVEDICPTIETRGKRCPQRYPSTPHSCSKYFDEPVVPVDKIDYTNYFNPPEDACVGLSCHGLFTILLTTVLVLKICDWV